MTTQAVDPAETPYDGVHDVRRAESGGDIEGEMTRLNLMRALRDTDVAIERVRDLTSRLVSLSEENKDLTRALHHARSATAEAQARYESVRAVEMSKTFRLVVGTRRAFQMMRRQ